MKHMILIFSLLLSTSVFADDFASALFPKKEAPQAQMSVEDVKDFARNASEFIIDGVTYLAKKTAGGVVLVYQVAKDGTLKALKAGTELVKRVVGGMTYLIIKTKKSIVRVYELAKNGTITALNYVAKKVSAGVSFIVVETVKGISLLIKLAKNGIIKIVEYGVEMIKAIKSLPTPTCNGREINFGGGQMICI